MTYIPQLVSLDTGTLAITPCSGYAAWKISRGGSGYVSGDIGSTVTVIGGTYTVAATATIESVSGGAITSLSPPTNHGTYTVLPIGDVALSGGSGSGAVAAVGGVQTPALFSPSGAGMPSSIAEMTFSLWGYSDCSFPEFLFGGANSALAGSSISFAITAPSFGHGVNISLRDSSGTQIFSGLFSGAGETRSAVYNILVSVSTTTQTIQVYVNDNIQTSSNAIWYNAHAVDNPAAGLWSLRGDISDGNVGLASFYAVASFTDLSVTANRRAFINADLSSTDPSTLPAAPINLYLNKGDSPSAIANNHGTGGAWTMLVGDVWPGGTPNPIVFSQGYCSPLVTANAASYTTNENTALTASLTSHATDQRPGGYLVYSASTSPSHGSVTVNADGTFTYTPTTGFYGSDSFYYEVTDTMPSGYVQPGYTYTARVSITVTRVYSVTMADLFFTPTPAFVDLSVASNRRKFITDTGGAQSLGPDGSVPLGVTPPVFLSSNGTPSTFAANNGRGGAFALSGTLTAGASNPPAAVSVSVTPASVPASAGQGVLGDYKSGNLYAFNPNTLTDNGTQRRWLRRWRALGSDGENAKRFSALVVDMQTGAGVPADSNPQLMLRWSDDGGATWSDGRIVPAGKLGATAQSIKFNRLGSTRRFGGSDRIFELSSTDQFMTAIIAAEVDVS